MRRGQPSRGGWRNEGGRHFRPRSGSPAGCRPPRGFMRPLLEIPRFPPPPPPHAMRYPYRGPSPWAKDNPPPVEYNRDNYRIPNCHLDQRNQVRHSFPREPNNRVFQNNFSNYNNDCMRDIDERRMPSQHGPRPPWVVRNNNHPYERPDNQEYQNRRIPQEYTGHRPPASDHYESNSGPTDDSDAFSQSVDDTVDIIRRRLLNRNDPQYETNINHDQNVEAIEPAKECDMHQDQTRKKRTLRPKEVKSCTNIKNKIVNQLFKMDKDRIHKLMDNPQSSSKFEYAMNTLITESQISYNRHMRATAEKSLNGSRNEINPYNESDSLYDDVFMKQMQCFVDPQDTVFLEDIKPFVLAELNKVLQIEELDMHLDSANSGQSNSQDTADCFDYGNENNYSDSHFYMEEAHTSAMEPAQYVTPSENVEKVILEDEYIRNQPNVESKPLFTRRSESTNTDKVRPSTDKFKSPDPVPLFDNNVQPLSDEDDPFAELDNQYHVAIDHNFIEDYDTPVASQNNDPNLEKEAERQKISNKAKISSEDVPSLSEARNKLKMVNLDENTTEQRIKKELLESTVDLVNDKSQLVDKVKIKEEHFEAKPKEPPLKPQSPGRARAAPRPRRRPADQRPSHRKEKRKKSKERSPETSKILNKNIIINVNDCAKTPEKSDASAKSVFNLYFSKTKKDTHRESRKSESDQSEKSTKRKDPSPLKPQRSGDSRKSSADRSGGLSPSKGDSKLKPIDMFTEPPRRPGPRAALRNTAPAAPAPDVRLLPVKSFSKKVTRRHTATQVHVKGTSQHTQTSECRLTLDKSTQSLARRFTTRAVQTDPAHSSRKAGSSDAFERMKEIDLEIQMLVQEKFKLYNSLESRDSTGAMQLGMTVVDVPSDAPKEDLPDAILEEFTSIPVEELEQIALESVDGSKPSPKRGRRRAMKAKRGSPLATKKVRAAAPNISLLEQIIGDDRPLEDIISLDELEVTPLKKKKKYKTKAEKKSFVDYKVLYGVRDCSVSLHRLDVAEEVVCHPDVAAIKAESIDPAQELEPDVEPDQFQVDMLDVSEDIVIGERDEPPPDVVDNSRPRAPDAAAGCRLYDYSADESLLSDAMTVTGNGDAILAIECIDDAFLAASLDGTVYHFGPDGVLLRALRGSNLPVTCVAVVRDAAGTTIYTGSLDSRIRYFDLETGLEKGPECNVLSPIQSMDRAWDTVFVGTRTGFVLQFECKNNMLIPVSTIKFSDQSILALRALKEGPRKVLLVASRSENVTVKDAQTGLLLRTLAGPKMTVYTLLYEDGKVYCGTSGSQIQIFDYASGSHTGSHEGGKGAVCLRAAGGLVFAGCYDGCVYVYRSAARAPLAQLRGAGAMLLSLAVVGSKVIAGYKDRSLYIWKLPVNILQEMVL